MTHVVRRNYPWSLIGSTLSTVEPRGRRPYRCGESLLEGQSGGTSLSSAGAMYAHELPLNTNGSKALAIGRNFLYVLTHGMG